MIVQLEPGIYLTDDPTLHTTINKDKAKNFKTFNAAVKALNEIRRFAAFQNAEIIDMDIFDLMKSEIEVEGEIHE